MKIVVIPGAQDFFFDKTSAWLLEHSHKIEQAIRVNAWWQKYALIVQTQQELRPSHLLRVLTDLGYEKVQTPLKPGEFRLRGGTVQLIPFVQADSFYQITFVGNIVESIESKPLRLLPTKKEIEESFRMKIAHSFLLDLRKGDYIVHLDHGIGTFIERRTIAATSYFVLEYAKGDTLMVPEAIQDKLSAYIGFHKPHIHRLGGDLWFDAKRKVRKEVEELAKKMLELYAKRELMRRPPYPQDDEREQQFAASFPFEETVDQRTAISDIMEDLAQHDRPMDRILTGDVGFGKTEVALRAAMKIIANGGQVAFLTPTTILADQHYRRIFERFTESGVRVALLTRATENKTGMLKSIADGEIDMVIGTHRLLSDDVQWRNLRFAIIDEEQKFGVRHKEHFKELRGTIDILSVTATPIPRTLYLALSHLRPVSSLHTPPIARQSIHTEVHEYDSAAIQKAIAAELARGGQVYYLFNRIRGIYEKEQQLQTMLQGVRTVSGTPVRIRVAHARMDQRSLLQTLQAFETGEFDILLATTIIENGLDLPNVNTLIVERAERLGLTQMHQIRGRVGRKGQKAFAYFFHAADLTEEAQKRLEYLERFQSLGDGYKLAVKDLEIRGAGNILGRDQSGPINAVGLNLYSQMLSEAVEELRRGNATSD